MDHSQNLVRDLLQDCCDSCKEAKSSANCSERVRVSSSVVEKFKGTDCFSLLCTLEAVLRTCENNSNVKHSPCLVTYVHRVFIESLSSLSLGLLPSQSGLFDALLRICNTLLDLPFTVSPIKLDDENSSSEAAREQNMKLHPLVFSACFKFYCSVLSLASGLPESTHILEDCTDASEIAEYASICLENRHICREDVIPVFKQTAAKGLYQAVAHTGKHAWVTQESKRVAESVLKTYLLLSKHESIASLLSGVSENIEKVLHHRGLFRLVLGLFCSSFTPEKWKADPSLKHRFVWCLTKVKYPKLGEFVSQVVPFLLLLIEDYEIDNKVLGISAVQYLIRNVNPADLRLYNHSDVLFEVLYQQLLSCKDPVLSVLLPCLAQVLTVIDSNPHTMKSIEFGKWDKAFEKVVQSMEYESKLTTRRIYSSMIPAYIDAMGAAVLKHTRRTLNVAYSYLEISDGEDEEARLNSLQVLLAVIRNAWPVMWKYQEDILKAVLRLLVDINSPGCTILSSTYEKMEKSAQSVLLAMRRCCGVAFENLLTEIVANAKVDPDFQRVLRCLRFVLEVDVNNYDLGIKQPFPF